MNGICVSCRQETIIYAKGLCRKCYGRERLKRTVGNCQECGREQPLSKGLCRKCSDKKRSLPKGKCARCGRWLVIKAKGMCAACSTAEHRKRTGYKGPIRICANCGEEKPIKARNLCNRCYQRWKFQQDPERIRSRKRDLVNRNRVRYLAAQKTWRDANKEHRAAYAAKYYQDNKDRLKIAKRIRNHKNREIIAQQARVRRHLKQGQNSVGSYKTATNPTNKIETFLKAIPELKRVWVDEFINGVYSQRDTKTKIYFLNNILKLIQYIYEKHPQMANGGWNTLSLVLIEECQVRTGVLKDSVRVFFNWLYSRKRTTVNLAEAIPTQTRNLSKKSLPTQELAALYKRWTEEDGLLVERIAGLLIIFYGFTNEQLRHLKRTEVNEKYIQHANKVIPLEQPLIKLTSEYMEWRRYYYIGLNDTNPYFFVNKVSIFTENPVSIGYFSYLFRKNGLPSPSAIRKSMILFYKNKMDCDPFALAALANISPRGAARYWE